MNKEYKGTNGNITVTDTGVTISRGVKGFLMGFGLKGNKNIPYSSITAVQFKKAGFMSGYIQLSLQGGFESRGGLMDAMKDENTIAFYPNKNAAFEEAKNIIEGKINNKNDKSSLDELEKLAELKEKGIITKEEFEAKKKAILAL